jgi:exodeoxyribonuclease VII small subunit
MVEKKKEETLSFERALARLEIIVKEMEAGDLPLEKMMAHFEEGSGLAKLCSTQLNEVEKKIELLVKKGESMTTAPFDATGKDV